MFVKRTFRPVANFGNHPLEGNDPENEMVSYIPEAAKKSKEPTVEELGDFSCTFDYK